MRRRTFLFQFNDRVELKRAGKEVPELVSTPGHRLRKLTREGKDPRRLHISRNLHPALLLKFAQTSN
jgi:hypothetical protein